MVVVKQGVYAKNLGSDSVELKVVKNKLLLGTECGKDKPDIPGHTGC